MPRPWFLKANTESKELLGCFCLTTGCSGESTTPVDKVGSAVTGEELN